MKIVGAKFKNTGEILLFDKKTRAVFIDLFFEINDAIFEQGLLLYQPDYARGKWSLNVTNNLDLIRKKLFNESQEISRYIDKNSKGILRYLAHECPSTRVQFKINGIII